MEWKNLTIEKGYNAEAVDTESILRWLDRFGKPLIPYIKDTTAILSQAVAEGKSILFEAQLGALRDIDYGIYPYTSASSTLAAYALIGAGIPFAKLDQTIGIMKAYSYTMTELILVVFPQSLMVKNVHWSKVPGKMFGNTTVMPQQQLDKNC